MIVRTYKARNGSMLSDDDAEIIGTYLASSFGDHEVRPEDFVISARPKKSPLHKHLEWDDRIAGEQWRLGQARQIIGALVVVETKDDGSERATRAYHNVTLLKDGGVERAYVPQHVVWETPDLREQVIRQQAARVAEAAEKLGEYEDLADEASTLRDVSLSLREKLAA